MSGIPTPRFAIGQVVFAAEATDQAVQADCPDCNNAKVWQAVSPAGETFEFACPRCQNHDVWKLRHQKAVPSIRRLTVGSIRLDSEDKDPVSYMCQETGVGSGTVWREARLAADEVEAAVLGRVAVAEREVWRATDLERRERNSGWGPGGMKHRLETALRYQSWTTAEISRANSEKWAIGYQFENLCNAIASLDDYGGVEGLDAATLERIVNELARDTPQVREARDSIMHDREAARKAA